MAIETWDELMAEVRQRDIVGCGKGQVTHRMAHTWSKNGMPHFDHSGAKKRWRYIIRAAALNGVTITGEEILRLSTEHKQKLAEGKL